MINITTLLLLFQNRKYFLILDSIPMNAARLAFFAGCYIGKRKFGVRLSESKWLFQLFSHRLPRESTAITASHASIHSIEQMRRSFLRTVHLNRVTWVRRFSALYFTSKFFINRKSSPPVYPLEEWWIAVCRATSSARELGVVSSRPLSFDIIRMIDV